MKKINITPKWAQILTIPTVYGIGVVGIAVILYPIFMHQIPAVLIPMAIAGISLIWFSHFMSILIPFIQLKAYFDTNYLYLENNGEESRYPVDELVIKYHKNLQYAEIFNSAGSLILCCDYIYKEAMSLISDVELMQKQKKQNQVN